MSERQQAEAVVKPGYPVSKQERMRAWIITLGLCPQPGCVFVLNHPDLCSPAWWQRLERQYERPYPD